MSFTNTCKGGVNLKKYYSVFVVLMEIKMNWIELNWIELNWTELNWIEMNWIELSWTELNWIELNWPELNWIELNWTELNWINNFVSHRENVKMVHFLDKIMKTIITSHTSTSNAQVSLK